MVKLLPFQEFCSYGRIPFNSEVNEKLVDDHVIARDHAIVIFISHVWYSNYSQLFPSESKSISPSAAYAPDDPQTHKIYSLIKEGVEMLMENMIAVSSLINQAFIWLDASCLDLSNEKRQLNLDEVIMKCDCLLTPITNIDSFFFEIEDFYDPETCNMYRTWIGTPFSYLSRAWCRLEFWYGMILPSHHVTNAYQKDKEASLSRLEEFKGSFAECLRTSQRRPHYLYTKDLENQKHLFLLPRISFDLFERYSPAEGVLGQESDRAFIKRETIILQNYLRQVLIGYQGELNKGLKHGKGELVYSDGSSYAGEWKNDLKEGKGIYRFPNGDVYEGDFYQDCIEGTGELRYANGNLVRGQFKDNLIHGEAEYHYNDGNFYSGQFVEGKRQGKGKYTFQIGGYYEGEFVNDVRHGKGVYYYANGCRYDGDFQNDHRHGFGKYYYTNGDVYEGQFENGHFNGRGKYFSKEGDCYEGSINRIRSTGKERLSIELETLWKWNLSME